jgi:hypothetical protein
MERDQRSIHGRTQVQLTETQARAVKKAAVEKGNSMAKGIRRVVEKMVESKPGIEGLLRNQVLYGKNNLTVLARR